MNDFGPGEDTPTEQFGPARLGPTASSAPVAESAEPPAVVPPNLQQAETADVGPSSPAPAILGSITVPGGRRRRPRRHLAAALGVLALAATGIAAGATGGLVNRDDHIAATRDAAPAPAAPQSTAPDADTGGGSGDAADPLYRDPDSVAGIAARVLESTVYIEAMSGSGVGSGTGVVFSEDGYIVTNNHVVASAAGADGQISVTLQDGETATAEIVGRTEDYDLAVLKVDMQGLTPLTFADSDTVVVGDPVVAVGAPLGLEGTVTTGIVSALNRAVTAGSATEVSYINAIQTDAAINPGNSGGPLVNLDGDLIGINSAIAQPPGSVQATGSIGLGFAIPANQVARTAQQLIETGHATYPIIGILLDGTHMGQGVKVSTQPTEDGTSPVTPGGPGEAAGVQPGDVILQVDGRPVTSPDEVIVTVRSHAPGDTITLTLERDGNQFDVDVVLGEQQAK